MAAIVFFFSFSISYTYFSFLYLNNVFSCECYVIFQNAVLDNNETCLRTLTEWYRATPYTMVTWDTYMETTSKKIAEASTWKLLWKLETLKYYDKLQKYIAIIIIFLA